MTISKRGAAVAVLSVVAVVGCAKTDAIPLSANEVQILVDAAPACGATGAQRLAATVAAVETVRRGFDRFVVTAVNGKSLASAIWTSPSATTDVSSKVTVSSGGWASISRRHQNTMRIRMTRRGDRGAERAIDARAHLGPKWRETVKDGASAFC